jgi:hypothetical protein
VLFFNVNGRKNITGQSVDIFFLKISKYGRLLQTDYISLLFLFKKNIKKTDPVIGHECRRKKVNEKKKKKNKKKKIKVFFFFAGKSFFFERGILPSGVEYSILFQLRAKPLLVSNRFWLTQFLIYDRKPV